MNHWWIAYDALIVTLGVINLALLASARVRRPFLAPFALFYLVFTGGLLIGLSRGYVTLNVTEPSAMPVFLSYGLGTVLSCATVYFALLFYLRVLKLQQPVRLRVVAFGLGLACVLTVSPFGVRFDPETTSYELLAGYYVAAIIYLIVFSHVMYLAARAAVLVADRYDTLFFRGMLAFAAIGYVESVVGLVADWTQPVGKLDAQSEAFLYSSIPYFLFSLFLAAYLLRLMQQAPAERALNPQQVAAIGLSVREQEILQLVLKGLNNKRIANELDISVATVKTHLHNIFRKANVNSRFELARLLAG